MTIIDTTGAQDDNFVNIPIPFPVNFLGSTYTSVYVGSNSYATFGMGSTVYSSISGANPPHPGIHVGAADNSFQRILYISESTTDGNIFRVRYEGTAATHGTIGSPNIVWELTFYQSQPLIVDVVVGANARGLVGRNGVTNGSGYLYTSTSSIGSYRIISN